MKKLIIALALLVSNVSFADEVFFGFGLGAFDSAKNSSAEVKVGQIGYRSEIWSGLYWQFKGGYWGDGSGDVTRKSSFYASSGPGVLVDLKPIEIRTGWGLAAISRTDSYLGGNFPQFNGEAYVGVRDRYGNGIGIQYEHISSAGLLTPNQGRDFWVLQTSWRF